jgi:4-carboxymuconolactone decarboxylase
MAFRNWAMYPIVTLAMVLLAGYRTEAAQEQGPMVKLSKLVIDPSELEAYKSALQAEVAASVRIEPGVLTLYAVFEKERPTRSNEISLRAPTAGRCRSQIATHCMS